MKMLFKKIKHKTFSKCHDEQKKWRQRLSLCIDKNYTSDGWYFNRVALSDQKQRTRGPTVVIIYVIHALAYACLGMLPSATPLSLDYPSGTSCLAYNIPECEQVVPYTRDCLTSSFYFHSTKKFYKLSTSCINNVLINSIKNLNSYAI